MQLDGIVLDLDDTLLDTTGLLLADADRRAIEAMRAIGFPMPIDEAQAHITSLREAGQATGVFAHLAKEVGADPAWGEVGELAFFDYDVPPLKVDPRVETALVELAEHAPLALLTLGVPRTQQQKIRRLGIEPWFAVIRYLDYTLGHDKAAALRALLAELDWEARRVVVIGDSVKTDIHAANTNGCLSILVNSGGERSCEQPSADTEHPWHICGHVSDVPSLLASLP